jgi:hypothetical protein
MEAVLFTVIDIVEEIDGTADKAKEEKGYKRSTCGPGNKEVL